ncbi:MAG TPA: protein kinase [Thermoanaerobaculia bacterium]|nr:protein kinase [Thermoanaerobaculia bacterium]
MTLSPGSRLGPYEIVSPLGAGGMGEVYKARDTRLDRSVAIKVLSQHLSVSPELRQRFEREARTISQLSHPHICALYDVGNQDGVEYLVMEYLEGETLAERLVKGALPLDQALRFAIEIADALDMAHRRGIVHRDLKPANVMLTRSSVKLLDFGLAKVIAPDPGPPLTSLPTQASPVTHAGTILGTFQYMAPEQLEGCEADARTDIFAFGAVLYEMATGKKAFSGRSQASLVSAIMTAEPPSIASQQPMTPPALDRIVKTCLAKDPEERWQSAHDIRSELQWIAQAGPEAEAAAAVSTRRRKRWGRELIAALFGVAVGAAATWVLAKASPEPPRVATHLAFETPAFTFSNFRSLAISPDGRRVTYAAGERAARRLFMRPLDRSEAIPVTGTEDALMPFFSPDGSWIAFIAAGKLQKVSIAGGPPVALCDLSPGPPLGASWGRDDNIVLAQGWPSELVRVPASGGIPQPLAKPTFKGEDRAYLWPEILPDGNAILFNVWKGGRLDDSAIAVRSLGTGTQRILLTSGACPRYAPTGHIVFARRGSLFAVPFDAKRLEVSGSTFPLVIEASENTNGGAEFAFSKNGTLAYVAGGLRQRDLRNLVWVNRKGVASPATAVKRPYNKPSFSPDGKRVAMVLQGETYDVWVLDLDRDNLARLSFGKDDGNPVWSPDGRQIAFASTRAGQGNVYVRAADGSGSERALTSEQVSSFPLSWSPDGKYLAFSKQLGGRETEIWLYSFPEAAQRPLLRGGFNFGAAEFSPDGRWLAYTSNESGRFEVYVTTFPEPGGRWQISNEGVSLLSRPRWSRDGREIFYSNDRKLMRVAVAKSPSFSASRPEILFEGDYGGFFDIAPDGLRFLMVKTESMEEPTRQVSVVLDWFSELKARERGTGN